MYGTETSVLLPLLSGMAVHDARPLFPGDLAVALAQVPAPRVLVTTPVHLRTLLASSQDFCRGRRGRVRHRAMDAALALRVATELKAPLLEMFGSTETCVIATRLTAHETGWRLYPGVTIETAADHAWVRAPWFDQATRLQDVVQMAADGRMLLRGRNVDMIEIAGKRASLSELTRRLLAIPRGPRCRGVSAVGYGSRGAGRGAGAARGGGRRRAGFERPRHPHGDGAKRGPGVPAAAAAAGGAATAQ